MNAHDFYTQVKNLEIELIRRHNNSDISDTIERIEEYDFTNDSIDDLLDDAKQLYIIEQPFEKYYQLLFHPSLDAPHDLELALHEIEDLKHVAEIQKEIGLEKLHSISDTLETHLNDGNLYFEYTPTQVQQILRAYDFLGDAHAKELTKQQIASQKNSFRNKRREKNFSRGQKASAIHNLQEQLKHIEREFEKTHYSSATKQHNAYKSLMRRLDVLDKEFSKRNALHDRDEVENLKKTIGDAIQTQSKEYKKANSIRKRLLFGALGVGATIFFSQLPNTPVDYITRNIRESSTQKEFSYESQNVQSDSKKKGTVHSKGLLFNITYDHLQPSSIATSNIVSPIEVKDNLPTKYIVQKGDCLSSILFDHGYDASIANCRVFARKNNLFDMNYIEPGQILRFSDALRLR